MHEFGTTIEQLAEIAVSTRYNASLNPDAYYRDPITDRRRARLADDRRPAHEAALLHPLRRRRRGRAHLRGAGAATWRERRCGCSAPARPSSHTTMSEWEDFTESPAVRSGEPRVRARRASPRPSRHVPDLRRVHPDGAALASRRSASARRARAGRSSRTATARRRVAADQHRRRRPVGVPPRDAGDVPARRGGAAAPRRGRRAARCRTPQLACVNGTGGWFSSASTAILGVE